MEAEYFNETYIADHSGTVLQSVQSNTEGFAISDLILPDSPPLPKGRQPPFGISNFTYLFDAIANRIFASEYKKMTKMYFSKQALPLKNDG